MTPLPPGWKKLALKRIALPGGFVDGDWVESPYITDEGIRLLQTGNIGIGKFKEQGFRYISERSFHLLRCTLVQPGEVLVCRLADPVGRACLAPDLGVKMVTSVDVAILRPRPSHDPRFIVYALSSAAYLGYLQSICRGGTRDRVSRSMLGDVQVAVPSTQAQRAIADFLDRKTAAVDALIDKKKRLIELNDERQRTVIRQVITKGIDSKAPMKESGCPSLGRIPVHWTSTRLKYIKARTPNALVDGPFGSNLKGVHFIDNGNVFVVESGFATTELLDEARLKTISAEHFATILRSETQGGDIIIAKIGAQFGLSAILPRLTKPAVVSGNSMKLTVDASRVVTAYLHFQLLCLKWAGAMDQVVNVTAQPALSLGGVAEVRCAVPPKLEQLQILQFLKVATEKFDGMKRKLAAQLELLREYRQGLITDAVTGQLDVAAQPREAA